MQTHPSDYIVVIGRQFGSGGRTLGRLVAQRLGIPYYDKELLMEAARKSGFAPEFLSKADETKPSPLRALLGTICGNPAADMPYQGFGAEKLYQAISSVITDIASSGPCVIVGRTADYVLRDHKNLLSVFVHAPVDYRAAKIVARGDAKNHKEAVETARRKDHLRQDYYNYFTGRSWGAADNYHLALDSSRLSDNRIADIIIASLEALAAEAR